MQASFDQFVDVRLVATFTNLFAACIKWSTHGGKMPLSCVIYCSPDGKAADAH